MKFYTYQKGSVFYKRFRFLKPKIIIWVLIIQVCISIALLFTISAFYDTPKEKKLKNDILYLLYEFDKVNQRVIESEGILQKVIENDSIISVSSYKMYLLRLYIYSL